MSFIQAFPTGTLQSTYQKMLHHPTKSGRKTTPSWSAPTDFLGCCDDVFRDPRLPGLRLTAPRRDGAGSRSHVLKPGSCRTYLVAGIYGPDPGTHPSPTFEGTTGARPGYSATTGVLLQVSHVYHFFGGGEALYFRSPRSYTSGLRSQQCKF